MGDPAGCGPQITAAAWRALHSDPSSAFYVIGWPGLYTGVPVELIRSPAEATRVYPRALPVLALEDERTISPGQPDPAAAPGIIASIRIATAHALSGEAGAVVTNPIHKALLYGQGFRFPGHTEFIAELTADAPFAGTRGPVMMLTAKDLRACLVTIHAPLAEVPELVTAERVRRTARVVHEAMKRDFGLAAPRLALAALNPHAGESGSIGLEEIEILAPAVAILRGEGIDISDPRPADTLFHDAARATYDAVLCLYHDQALIPVKTLDFWGGVNATLGLPVVRTSPDHGTGFDIAGKGVARADSLVAAVRLAGVMAGKRRA